MKEFPKDLVAFIKKELGIELAPGAEADFFIHLNKLSPQKRFLKLKQLLLEHQALVPLEVFHSNRLPLYRMEDISAPDPELTKVIELIHSMMLSFKKLLWVKLKDPDLKALLDKEEQSPFNQALFIFKEDFDNLQEKKQEQLIVMDFSLAGRSIIQAFNNQNKN